MIVYLNVWSLFHHGGESHSSCLVILFVIIDFHAGPVAGCNAFTNATAFLLGILSRLVIIILTGPRSCATSGRRVLIFILVRFIILQPAAAARLFIFIFSLGPSITWPRLIIVLIAWFATLRLFICVLIFIAAPCYPTECRADVIIVIELQ